MYAFDLKAFIGNLSIKIHLFWRQQPDSLVALPSLVEQKNWELDGT